MLRSLFHLFLIEAYVLLVLPNVKYFEMQICSRPSFYFFKTDFMPVFISISTWKDQKTRDVLVFAGGLDMEHWRDMC